MDCSTCLERSFLFNDLTFLDWLTGDVVGFPLLRVEECADDIYRNAWSSLSLWDENLDVFNEHLVALDGLLEEMPHDDTNPIGLVDKVFDDLPGFEEATSGRDLL